MADIRGVGKPITYSDEGSPIEDFMRNLRREWEARRREPRDQAERELLGRWLGYRGREELECIVGSATYAYTHFAGEMDSEWRRILADHIGTEAGHGWGLHSARGPGGPEPRSHAAGPRVPGAST